MSQSVLTIEEQRMLKKLIFGGRGRSRDARGSLQRGPASPRFPGARAVNSRNARPAVCISVREIHALLINGS